MRKKIVITAANGFMGNALMNYLSKDYEVIGLVRSMPQKVHHSYLLWDGKTLGPWTKELEGAFAIVNLAGRSVDCRYNERNKTEILESRINSTRILGVAIDRCVNKPKLWINAASATIYRHSLDLAMTEERGEIGSGFSVEVCKKWEQQFYNSTIDNVRKIALRTAIVLGKNGGVMRPFMNLVRFGFGGKMASGRQLFSWIHIEDFCRIIDYFFKNEACEGTYNISSPYPISNDTFMSELRKGMRMPIGIPMSRFILELGARVIKTETELILKSRFVIPKRLLDEGFLFKYPRIDAAINEIVR